MSSPIGNLQHFLDSSVSPYHAVEQARARLQAAGFSELQEGQPWVAAPGDRILTTRGGSSIAAFVVGQRPPCDAGFRLVGAHTDSPNLRIKPRPDVRRHGYNQLAVEPYGGVLLSTWLDRDLGLAGRVMLSRPGAGVESLLVDIRRPIARIPNLAIHLNRNVNIDGLILNPQQHMVPIIGLDGANCPPLSQLLSEELAIQGSQCADEDIVGWDLGLYDLQMSSVAGARGDFIHSGRLDNLASCHGAIEAIASLQQVPVHTAGVVLYDHEEVGNQSAQGAGSSFLRDCLHRLADAQSPGGAADTLPRAMAHSFLISADMAHAVHPNYADRHEPGHQPLLGGGPVLKRHAGQAYATDGESAARFSLLCREAGVPFQHFVTRSDLGCGSTIGPVTAARLGLRTVDIGSPLLSMHSIREMAAVADVARMQTVLTEHLK